MLAVAAAVAVVAAAVAATVAEMVMAVMIMTGRRRMLILSTTIFMWINSDFLTNILGVVVPRGVVAALAGAYKIGLP